MGLITNSPDDIVVGLLKYFGIYQYFQFIVAASLINYPKPSAQFSDFLVKKACSDPQAIAIAGDGDEDGLTAKMIGARFYRVRRNLEEPISDTDYCGVIDNLSDLVNLLK